MPSAAAIQRRRFLTGARSPPSRDRLLAAISDDCLARAGIVCMSCRDACPEQAIRLRRRIGSPFLPEIIKTACTGCGACLAPCPAHAITLAEREPDADV